jgi:hypothetical protein
MKSYCHCLQNGCAQRGCADCHGSGARDIAPIYLEGCDGLLTNVKPLPLVEGEAPKVKVTRSNRVYSAGEVLTGLDWQFIGFKVDNGRYFLPIDKRLFLEVANYQAGALNYENRDR